MFARLESTAAMDEGISIGGSLNDFTTSLRRFFIAVFNIALSSGEFSVVLEVGEVE